MRSLVVIELPGFSQRHLEHAPAIRALSEAGFRASLAPVMPAVTMPAHASLLTGLPPREHGVVANGWYFREHNEVMMWRQSEGLVHGEKVWEAGRKRNSHFRCLKHFWWPGMNSTADLYTNVRPAYHADGRKSPDMYANRPGLARTLQERFGTFPLFHFWGPATNIKSSSWIAESAKFLFDREQPTLSLVYLPHMDYRQQTLGPDSAEIASDVKELDALVGDLVKHVQAAGAEVMILSSYTMNAVDTPVDLNRHLRREDWLQVIENATGELIDFAESAAFAVADHQIAHVYVRDPQQVCEVRSFIEGIPGVAKVLDREGQAAIGLDHAHSGELVVLAETNAWFTYYYWLDADAAPDFARTIAIHAKPGYDPCEMIMDPAISLPKVKLARKLAWKMMGGRMVMDVIPTDPKLVKGSHGVQVRNPQDQALYICTRAPLEGSDNIPMTRVKQEMLAAIFD
jgi:predicted AlkP superfamily pyrophosphatase or phosphodiesterase